MNESRRLRREHAQIALDAVHEWQSVAIAAKYLGLSERTIRRRVIDAVEMRLTSGDTDAPATSDRGAS